MTCAATAVLASAATLSAQSVTAAGWTNKVITNDTGTGRAGVHHVLAFAPSKKLGEHTTWSLLREVSPERLFLRVSLDAGCTDFDTTNHYLRTLAGHGAQTGGCMVMGDDCRTLHILYGGYNAGGFASVYYDAWDTANCTWIGPNPQVIADGESSSAQIGYDVGDIEVTGKGRVVIAYNCGRPNRPSQPWFTSWWSSVVRVAPPPLGLTQADFPNSGYPINEVTGDPLGQSWGVNLHAVGECVHASFYAPQDTTVSKIYYRGFDANGPGWKQAAKVALPIEATDAAVRSSITTNDDCSTCDYKIYILFASHHGGSGNLWITCADNAATPSFSSVCLVDTDPPIQAGQNWLHFSLADGPNREVHAVYSKWNESFRNLYSKTYVGVPSCAETRCDIELTTINNRFRSVLGARSSLVMSNPYVSVGGLDTNGVRLYRKDDTARVVGFNTYLGIRPNVPRLTAINTPTVGGPPFCITLCEVPPDMPGVLLVGTMCTELGLPPPFEGGSLIQQNALAVLSYVTTPCSGGGHMQMCLTLPTSLLKGQSLYFQAVQFFDFTPTLVPSNSMAVIFDEI